MKVGARKHPSFILIFLAMFTVASQVAADSRSCSQPAKPDCISRLGITRDKSAFSMCGDAVDAHRQQVQDYLKCLDDSRTQATDEFNKAVRQFNCYAKGNASC